MVQIIKNVSVIIELELWKEDVLSNTYRFKGDVQIEKI